MSKGGRHEKELKLLVSIFSINQSSFVSICEQIFEGHLHRIGSRKSHIHIYIFNSIHNVIIKIDANNRMTQKNNEREKSFLGF